MRMIGIRLDYRLVDCGECKLEISKESIGFYDPKLTIDIRGRKHD